MATSDLPWSKRVDVIRAMRDAIKQPHNNWLERWAVFGRWVARSPEYVSWLLDLVDAQAVQIAHLKAELAKLTLPTPEPTLPPPRLPPTRTPPPLPDYDPQEVDFSDIFTEDQ